MTQILALFSWPLLILTAWILSWQGIKYWEKRFNKKEENKATSRVKENTAKKY